MPRSILAALALVAAPCAALAQEAEPGTVHLSRNKCDWASVGEIAQFTDSVFVPVAQELVNEGKLVSYGVLTHDYGDSWNVVWFSTAADRAALLSGNDELFARVSERHPDLNIIAWYAERCTDHEDLIYSVGPHTSEPDQ